MKKVLAILSILTTVLTVVFYSQRVKAADSVTHLYTATLVAAAAGIDMNYALTLGLGNEQIDRGLWSTPMGLSTPRLLYHFMGTPVNFTVNEGGLQKYLALATIDHPLFYNFLQQGLQSKNPVFLGAALHLLIDTYYHAGYSNLLGHAEGGHRPDMPYDEVQKAKLCLQAIIEMNYLIRKMLPKESVDFTVMDRLLADVTKNEAFAEVLRKEAGVSSNLELRPFLENSPQMMLRIIMEHNEFRNAAFTNMEKTEGYFRLAMRHLLRDFKTAGTVALEPNDLLELESAFKDVMGRNDIDPKESLKIVVYRILLMQDPALKKQEFKDMVKLGYDSEQLTKILEKGQFDFSNEMGVGSKEDINIAINKEAYKSERAVPYVVYGIKELISKISVVDANGKTSFLKLSQWSQETHTYANNVIPEMISWMTLIDSKGEARLTEHRDLGKIFSTQTDVQGAFRILDRFPEYLSQNLEALENLAANSEKLMQVSRMKAMADIADYIAHNATKDLFPGKLGPTQKVIYENDKLNHAVFAHQSRISAMQALIAKTMGIVIVSEPRGFHTYLFELFKKTVSKFKFKKVLEIAEGPDAKRIDQLKREYLLSINLAAKEADGRIVMLHEKETIMDANGKEIKLVRVNPNLTFRGYKAWTNMTRKYVGYLTIMSLFPFIKFISNYKNKIIKGYIEQGRKMKSEVIKAIESEFYSNDKSAFEQFVSKYGNLPLEGAKGHLSGLLDKVKVGVSSTVRTCKSLMSLLN